jgi:hypothetical protein
MFALEITGINQIIVGRYIYVLLVSKLSFPLKKIHSPANYQYQSHLVFSYFI